MSEIRVFNAPVPPGGYPFYAWFVGEDNEDDNRKPPREYFFACITDERFYVSRPLESVAKRIAESNRLQLEHPNSVFKNGRSVDLRQIDEVRCTKSKERLEFVKDDSIVFRVIDEKTRQCRKMLDDIRSRLAPRNPVEERELSLVESLGIPVCLAAIVLVFGVFLCAAAANARQELEVGGRRGAFDEMLNSSIDALTFEGCIALTVTAVAGSLAWVVYRVIHPLKCDMVRLR